MIFIKTSIILLLLVKNCNLSLACPDGMKLFIDEDGLPECFSCRDCPDGNTKVGNCTYKHDTICEKCTKNEYYDDRRLQCRKCTVCNAGYYARRNCSAFRDTECAICSSGDVLLAKNQNKCAECKTAAIACQRTGEENEKQHAISELGVIFSTLVIIVIVSTLVLIYRRVRALRHQRPTDHYTVNAETDPFIDPAQTNGASENILGGLQDFSKNLKSIYKSMLSALPTEIFGEPFAEFNMTLKTLEQQEPKEVKHVRDIFSENGISFKRICVIGEASIGKTTLCRSILHNFCCSDAPEKDSSTCNIGFDWYFFISLAKYKTTSNVLDMIRNRYFQNREHLLPEIFEKSKRVLVILDDFDIWKVQQDCDGGDTAAFDTLNIDELQSCTVLIITRPKALIRFESSKRILECDSEVTMKEITVPTATEFQKALKEQLKVANDSKTDSDLEKDNLHVDDFRITHPLLLKQHVRLYCSTEILKNPEEPLCKTIGKIVLDWLKDGHFIDETRKQGMRQLPECLKAEEQDHTFLLSLLGKASYAVLIEHDSTYFNLISLRDAGMSEYMIESCQKIGLLTQGLDNCLKPDDVTLVSFPHILYLDYFAAVHLFMYPEDVAKLLEKCHTAKQMMSFRYIFIFLSGMNSSAMSSAFKKMRDILDNETFAYLKSNIQYLVVECVGDQQQSSDTLLEIYISSDIFNGNISIKGNTFLKSLQKCDSLKCVTLEMHDRMDTFKEGLLLQAIKTKQNTLKTLVMIGPGCTPYLELFHCDKVLRLTHLEISHIELSHADKHQLMRGVAEIVSVQVLILVDIKCKDHKQCPCPLKLVSCTQLKKLTLTQIQLGWVTVSTVSLTECIEAETAVFYFPKIKKFRSSTELILKNLGSCDVDAFADLLSSLSELTHLEVSNSDFGDKGILLSEGAKNLKMIKMKEVNMTEKKLIEFVDSIPQKANNFVCEFEDISHPISEDDINKRFKVTRDKDCHPHGLLVKFKVLPTKWHLF